MDRGQHRLLISVPTIFTEFGDRPPHQVHDLHLSRLLQSSRQCDRPGARADVNSITTALGIYRNDLAWQHRSEGLVAPSAWARPGQATTVGNFQCRETMCPKALRRKSANSYPSGAGVETRTAHQIRNLLIPMDSWAFTGESPLVHFHVSLGPDGPLRDCSRNVGTRRARITIPVTRSTGLRIRSPRGGRDRDNLLIHLVGPVYAGG